MKSRPVSVNVTANGLAANQAQQTANQAQASANKYRTEWEKVNSENLAALSTAQSEFESNLAWAKSQIYEGQHQSDSAVASLQSDMESSWHSMSTVEENLYNSASTATSEVDSHLESLRAQNSQSMADLHSAANSLHAAANSLHADADSMRASLTSATSEVGNELANARNSLAAVDADLRNGISKAGNDLSVAKTSLTATGNSLATATSELQRKTGQLSGSLSSADSMIMYNSNAIAEVKRTAGEVRADLTNTQSDVASVKATANAISTDLTNAKGDIASVKAKADSLTTQMADATGNISQLQQTASGLQSTVAGQDGKISQLQHNADGLNFTVANGSQNLILNSGNPSTLEHWTTTGNIRLQAHPFWKNGTENLFVLSNTSSTDEKIFSSDRFQIEPNQTYTLSFYAFNNSALKNVDVWYLPRKAGSSNGFDAAFQLATNVGFSHSNAQYIKLTFNSGNYNEGYIRFDNNSSTTEGTSAELWLTDIQLEKGSIATAWHPSPGDIANLKITADGLTSKVADTQGNVSTLQQTATMMQKQITDNKGNISSVKNTADEVRTDLTNAKGDISTLKSRADSLTSSMTNAQGQISTLQQQADRITTTLSQGGNNLLNNSQGNFQPKNSKIDNWQPFEGANVYMTQGRKYTVSAQSASGFAFDSRHDPSTESNRIVLWLVDNGVNQIISSDTTDISKGGTHFTWNHASGIYTLRVNSYRKDNSGYAYHVKIEYGDTATPWKPSNGDISSLQQTASSLTSDMKDAKGNISSLQAAAGKFTTRFESVDGSISSLQQTSKELDTQIKAVDGRATTIKATADGISARVSKIEGNKVVGSLLKLDDNEAGLGTYVNNKLIAGINTNPDGVTIDGKNIHLNGQTHIDDGVINASKITVYNTVGDNKGNQYLAVAWGQLNSTIGGKDDRGNTLWGSINQTKDKFSSYYTRADVDNKLSQQSSLISQTADNITAIVNDAKTFSTYTVSASNPWDFNLTKSIYGNWFLNGEANADHVYNGPKYTNGQRLTPYMYVTSRGPKDGSRFVVTVWKDNDPTQYQRVWSENKWSEWVMLPNSQNLISAINLSPDSVKISGKNIELNGNTRIIGGFNLVPNNQTSQDQRNQHIYHPWVWSNGAIKMDNGVIQTTATNATPGEWYDGTNTNSRYVVGTVAPMYLKYTLWDGPSMSHEYARTYIDAYKIETPTIAITNSSAPINLEDEALYVGDFEFKGAKIKSQRDSLYVSNVNGTNFDSAGSVGFQVWSGIGLGQATLYTPGTDLYVQQGNTSPSGLKQSYSNAPKTQIHCQKVISQVANTVSSRLSVKTAITKVTYDRALMAVQNTDMYDYRYTADDSGQHYVSGIIDDIHDKPEYNMDPMLINQERTARIDANLLGYHHVVLQEILKRLDKLEAK